jgi:peptidylprolyl isomerase
MLTKDRKKGEAIRDGGGEIARCQLIGVESCTMKTKYVVLVASLLLLAMLVVGCAAQSAAAKNGDTVQVNYTGKLADGTVFDSSLGEGREPLEFTLGQGQLIPGFEKAVLGMKVGQKKTVTISPAEAYGPHRDDLVIQMDRQDLPVGANPQVGQQLPMVRNNRLVLVTVLKVEGDTVTLDFNNPLAGKDLTFDIELLKIK